MSTGTSLKISSALLSAEISPLGAELQTITDSHGNGLQWDGDPHVWRGRAPILFPVIGELNGGHYRLDDKMYAMPKHGFAREAWFEVATRDESSATFQLRPSVEMHAIYPFAFGLDITFTISESTLTLSATIANQGDEPMPASFGFHPALRWPLPYGELRGEHRLVFADEEPAPVRRIDREGLLLAASEPSPVVGRTLFLRDDLFAADALIFDALNSPTVTYGAPTGPQVEVSFSDFPTLSVWTKPGAGFLCIEPWHGFSDPVGFAGDIRDKPGIFMIGPGDLRTMAMSIALVAPPPR